MKLANPVSWPPNGDWDRRLTAVACPDLAPVTTIHENEWFAVRNRGGYFTTEFQQRHVVVLSIVEDSGIVMIRVPRPVIGDTTSSSRPVPSRLTRLPLPAPRANSPRKP